MGRFLRWLFCRSKPMPNPYQYGGMREGAEKRCGNNGPPLCERPKIIVPGTWARLKPGEDIDTPRDPSMLTLTSWIRKHQ